MYRNECFTRKKKTRKKESDDTLDAHHSALSCTYHLGHPQSCIDITWDERGRVSSGIERNIRGREYSYACGHNQLTKPKLGVKKGRKRKKKKVSGYIRMRIKSKNAYWLFFAGSKYWIEQSSYLKWHQLNDDSKCSFWLLTLDKSSPLLIPNVYTCMSPCSHMQSVAHARGGGAFMCCDLSFSWSTK